MSLVVLAGLIRIVPYAIVGIIAYRKKYKWLTFGAIYLVCVAIFGTFAHISPELRGVLGSVTALFLLRHALDIPPRN